MGLEMKVYREIKGYEAKVMLGMSWRQMASMALGIPVAGGLFAAVTLALMNTGSTRDSATNTATYVMFVALLPFAAWGWWRPMSLKPEHYIGYLLRHTFTQKVIHYADSNSAESVAPHAGSRPAAGGTAPGAGRRGSRGTKRPVPSEHRA